jgi:hypothetical protein
MQRTIPILWALVIILLILNLALLVVLNQARLTALETLTKVETTLSKLAQEVIVYDIEVNQPVPMAADIPFRRKMEIPLKTTIPIDQELTFPLQTPAGEIILDVPIKTDFPVDIVVPVDFNEVIPVDTTVQLNTTIPVEIDIARTPLVDYLREASGDLSRLRNRLGTGNQPVVWEEPVRDEREGNANVTIEKEAPSQTESEGAQVETNDVAQAKDASSQGQETVAEIANSEAEQTIQGDPGASQLDLGFCAHEYWPLRAGTRWTYNSPETSYTHEVIRALDNRVDFNTSYEGQTIQFNLICYREGLGGGLIGDMRRISEFGDLLFNNPRGMFLPRPEVIENIGRSWQQEFDVTGELDAMRGDDLIRGVVRQGRAVATYTPTRFETVETPLGLREALRIEQKLRLDLDVDFELGPEVVASTEVIDLTTIYWFVKGIGPVKTHWQGGELESEVVSVQEVLNENFDISALPEDQLAFVCVAVADNSVECLQVANISDGGLTIPPPSELEVQLINLPLDIMLASDEASEEVAVSATATAVTEANVDQTELVAPSESGDDGDDQDDELAAYILAVSALQERVTQAAKTFFEVALSYQADQITREQLRAEFLNFQEQMQAPQRAFQDLSPPSAAEPVHQTLTEGLSKCNQALELLDEWFDTSDDNTRDRGTAMALECVNILSEAQSDLEDLAD